MKLFEVRDQVRENIGRDKAPEHLLKYALDKGLREIEKTGNYWWMRATKTWNCVISQQAYNMTVSTSNGLNIPKFKDFRILLTQDQTLSNPDWDEVFGPIDIEEAGLEFADTDTGMPVIYSLDESTATATNEALTSQLLVWPPLPDKIYNMRLHYYQWTALPTDINSESHDILLRFPEALIYIATAVGVVAITKDPQMGLFWQLKFDNPGSPKDPGELMKIKRYNLDRTMDSRSELRPMRGGIMSRRSRWRRNREIWI